MSRLLARVAGVALVLLVALGACGSPATYELVCASNGRDSVSDAQCVAVAAAAIRVSEASDQAGLVTLQAYRGCPPAAFCGLRPELRNPPLSALVGIRFAHAPSVMLVVADVDALPLVAEPIGGKDPDEFIDGLSRASGTRRP